MILRPPGTQVVAVTTPEGSPSHIEVSADGKWLIGLLVGSSTAQIVKINLGGMSVIPLVSLGSWTGNERPAFSPHAEHFSYTLRSRMVKGIPEETLMADGRLLYSCPGVIDYRWLDEQNIAAACQENILLLDAGTGKVLSEHGISAAMPPR